MLTTDALKALGANTEEGLTRCMNNESFYLKMVDMGLKDRGFEKLQTAIQNNDRKTAFEAAHALKGIISNLALTPLAEPVSELTELLRDESEADCGPLLEQILMQKDRFYALLD